MVDLTPDQLAKREANKQRAIEKLKAARERLAAQKMNASVGGNRPEKPMRGSAPSISSSSSAAPSSSQTNTIGGVNINNKRPNENGQHRNAATKKFRDDYTSRLTQNYIEYDFSKVKDSKGGFMTSQEEKKELDKKMQDEWKEHERLNQQPTLAPIKCFDCESAVDIDYKLYNVFNCRVCKNCREEKPEKYSMLTKTEVKQDYLLTDPELRDTDLLKHLERPNPHKQTFNNMMLYLRYQVEEVAFKKWGGEEGLDAEYFKREEAKKARKDKKFLTKLKEMRRTTRANIYTNKEEKHVHQWSSGVLESNGMTRKRCEICGLTVEEIVMG